MIIKLFLISQMEYSLGNEESTLPPTESISVLAENFSEFFQTKIDNITEKLQDKVADLDNRYIDNTK